MLNAVGNNLIAIDIVVAEEEKTESGIFIPVFNNSLNSNVGRAKIIDSKIEPIQKEDIVIYHKQGVMPITQNGKEYLVIPEQNVVAKIIEGDSNAN